MRFINGLRRVLVAHSLLLPTMLSAGCPPKEFEMKLITLICSLSLATTGLSVQAGGSSPLIEEATNLIDSRQECEDEANKDDDECLLLPPVEEATNFIFALGPLLPIAAAAGLIAAATGGGGTSTPSSNQ